jgi:single-strand DNA-binding protein
MGKWFISTKQKGEEMSNFQKVFILGRLGQDPEMKHTPSGNAVLSMSVATSENWIDKASGEKQEKTEWHKIVVWNKTAELCNQHLKKGSIVHVEGKLETRSWEDKDGNKRYTTEIKAKTVQFIGAKGKSNNTQANLDGAVNAATKEFNLSEDATFASEDIPF